MSVDRVNLLPRKMRKGAAPDLQAVLVVSWVGALVIMAILTGLKINEVKKREQRYIAMMETAKSMGASVQEITSKVQSAEEANRKIASTKEFLDNRVTWTEVLKELSLLIPNTVWLTNLTTKEAKGSAPLIELVGEASSQKKIAGFLESLETSYFFRDINMKTSEKLQDISPALYRFTFDVEIPQLAGKSQGNSKEKDKGKSNGKGK